MAHPAGIMRKSGKVLRNPARLVPSTGPRSADGLSYPTGTASGSTVRLARGLGFATELLLLHVLQDACVPHIPHERGRPPKVPAVDGLLLLEPEPSPQVFDLLPNLLVHP